MDIQPNFVPNQTPTISHKKRILSGVLLAIALALIAGNTYLYYLRNYYYQSGLTIQQETDQKIQELEVKRRANLLTPSQLDTSTWRTYRNEEYGFEFKYPGEFELRKGSSSGEVLIAKPEVFNTYLGVFRGFKLHPFLNYKQGTALEKIISDYNYSNDIKKSNLTPIETLSVDGVMFYTFISPEGLYYFADGSGGQGLEVKSRFYYFDIGAQPFEIFFPDEEIYNQILSTFRFIESINCKGIVLDGRCREEHPGGF